jgi:hypothetical protein
MSSTDRDLDPDMEQANKKKVRGESVASSVTDVAHDGSSKLLPETEGVKEVTEGVKEVELTETAAPESIPLPAEESDELDEPASAATPPPETDLKPQVAATEAAPASDIPELNAGPETTVDPLISDEAAPASEVKEGEVTVETPSEEVPVPSSGGIEGSRRSVRSKTKEDTSTKD